jgi:hypothetical protein
MIDAIKSHFKLEVNRLYEMVPKRFQITIATLKEARMYAEQYNEPELPKRFEAAATEDNGKKTHHPIGFLPPKAREQAEALIFEELRPYFINHFRNEWAYPYKLLAGFLPFVVASRQASPVLLPQ